jgi:hypothetical protein
MDAFDDLLDTDRGHPKFARQTPSGCTSSMSRPNLQDLALDQLTCVDRRSEPDRRMPHAVKESRRYEFTLIPDVSCPVVAVRSSLLQVADVIV